MLRELDPMFYTKSNTNIEIEFQIEFSHKLMLNIAFLSCQPMLVTLNELMQGQMTSMKHRMIAIS